jgi:glycosyltransferase involved in cell wall biosynthesis
MRICYLAAAGNNITQKWVNYFGRKGHEVHVISRQFSHETPGEGYFEGIKVHLLRGLLPQHWAIAWYVNMWFWCLQVRRLIKKIKPDVIDAHYITTYGHLAIASGFHPVVLTAWGSDILIEPKKNRLIKCLTRYALSHAQIIVCTSADVRKEIIKLGMNPDRIRIIYCGVDTEKFNPLRGRKLREKLGLHDEPVIISTRKLNPIYNVAMLIRAIPLVLKQAPQARFIIAGTGRQSEYLKNLANSLGISRNINFVGWLMPDDLPDYLASADIYVSTSLSDSGSISLHEAMACELAPVVTDLPSIREWINDGENGLLVPVNNYQALAEKIIYLIQHKEIRERFGQENRRIIKEKAEYEEQMEQAEKLYEQLLR